MTINKAIIKCMENYTRKIFPKDLVHYLMVTYTEEPFPYEYSEQDLYSNIERDVHAYYTQKLDTTVKSSYKWLKEERDSWRSACIELERANEKSNAYIRELENLLAEHSILTEQMKARYEEEKLIF